MMRANTCGINLPVDVSGVVFCVLRNDHIADALHSSRLKGRCQFCAGFAPHLSANLPSHGTNRGLF